MTLRGLRPPARMAMHCRNARIGGIFAADARVDGQLAVCRRIRIMPSRTQMRDFGGMLSVQVRGGREAALASPETPVHRDVARRLRVAGRTSRVGRRALSPQTSGLSIGLNTPTTIADLNSLVDLSQYNEEKIGR
jgi:hypothetical protein